MDFCNRKTSVSCWPENKIDITLFFYFCKPLVSECLNNKENWQTILPYSTYWLFPTVLLSRNDYETKGQIVDIFFQKGSWAICQLWGSPLPYRTAFLYHYPKHNCSNLLCCHILVCMYLSSVKQKQKNGKTKKQKIK